MTNTSITSAGRKTAIFEEVQDIVTVLRTKEEKLYHNNCPERIEITEDPLVALWRQLLIEWMYSVVMACDLQDHSVAAAVYYFDIAIIRQLCTTKAEYQLAAVTALQLALKTYDTAVIRLEELIQLGGGNNVTDDAVADMEMQIISCLQWHLHPPTIYCFFTQYEQLLNSTNDDDASSATTTTTILRDITRLIAEDCTIEEQYLPHLPSLQSYCAMLVALEFITNATWKTQMTKQLASILGSTSKNRKVIKKVCALIRTSLVTKHHTELYEILINSSSTTSTTNPDDSDYVLHSNDTSKNIAINHHSSPRGIID